MKEITLALNQFTTKEEAHQYLREALNLPDYYGENLDALYDCLGDIGTPTLINVPRALADDKHLGAYGATMLKVFLMAAEENKDIKIKMI